MAAQREVIREFLYSLGFQVDASSAKRFFGQINTLTGLANAAGKAVVSVAVAAKAMVTAFANQMEGLYYSSQRTKAAVKNIQALEYGFAQIGMSAQDARGVIEGMAGALRNNPGLKGLIDSLLGKDTSGMDTTKQAIELVKVLSKMPHYVGSQYAQMFGIDEKTFLMMVQKLPELEQSMARRSQWAERAGFDAEKAAAASREYMNSMRSLLEVLEVVGQTIAMKLLPYFQEFSAWAEKGLKSLVSMESLGSSFDMSGLIGELKGIVDGLVGIEEEFHILKNLAEVLGATFSAVFSALGATVEAVVAGIRAALRLVTGDLEGLSESNATLSKIGNKFVSAGRKFVDWANSGSNPFNPFASNSPAPATATPAAVPTAPVAPVGGGNLPLGLRQNNPGNLRSWGNTPTVGGFANFGSMSEGLSAMAKQLILYGQRGLNSVSKIISTYAPSSENDTAAYISAVSKRLGVGATDTLNLKDPETLSRVMGAMIQHEQGRSPFSQAELLAAAQSRLGGGAGMSQTNNIHITGVSDPNVAAKAVGREINQANATLVRNHAGAVQ